LENVGDWTPENKVGREGSSFVPLSWQNKQKRKASAQSKCGLETGENHHFYIGGKLKFTQKRKKKKSREWDERRRGWEGIWGTTKIRTVLLSNALPRRSSDLKNPPQTIELGG